MQGDSHRFYFGRFSLQVPTTGDDTWSSYKIAQSKVQLISKNGKKDIDNLVRGSIQHISKLHKSGYPAYDQNVSLEGGGAIVVSKSNKYNFDIYYLTSENTLYRQQVESVSLTGFEKSVQITRDINANIHFRKPTTPPPENTFAIDAGYLKIPLNKYPEQVSIGLPITTLPGIHIIFDTRIIGKPEPGLIARYEERISGGMTKLLQKVLSSSTLMRKRKVTITDLPFEELLVKTPAEGRVLYSFRLEYSGTPGKSLEPYTVIELSTLEKGKSFSNDEEALEFWDRLVDSIERI